MPSSDDMNEIVAVDDSPSNLAVLSRVLHEAGYEMRTFKNSALALKSIHTRPPAVILLDVRMPDMDGYEVCRRLKADEQTRDIPVIFISALNDEQAKLAGFQAGGVDYINKPFSEAEVLARVTVHVKLRQTQRALAQQNAKIAAVRAQLEMLVEERTTELAAANAHLVAEIADHQRAEDALRENERTLSQLKKAIETTGLGITITDTMGKIIYTNPADAQMHGYAVNDLIGQPAHIFTSPEYRLPLRQANNDEPVFQDWRRERPNMRRDGSLFPAKLTSNPIYDTHKFRIGTVTVCEDISEQKRMETALRESEERFRLIAETIQEVFWIADSDTRRTFYISPSYEEVWQRSRQSLYDAPQSFIDAVHPEDRARVMANLEIKKTGQPFEHEYRILLPDGSIRWIFDRGFPVCEGSGEITRYVGVARDITDRRFAEEALQESELMFRTLFEEALNPILIVDEQGCYHNANRAALEFLEYSLTELLTKKVWDFTPSALFELQQQQHSPFHARKTLETDYLVRGQIKTLLLNIVPVTISHQNMLFGIGHDITARKEMETALHESEERLRNIVQNMPILCDAFDQYGVPLFWNKECERVTGYAADEIVNNPNALELLAPDPAYRVRVIEQLNSLDHQYRDWELEIRRKDGERRVIAWSNISRDFPIPGWWSWGVGVDVTDRKRAEEALRESEKRLREAQRLAHIGSWQWIVATDTTTWSEELYHINKRDLTLAPPGYADLSAYYTPESWERLRAMVTKALQSGEAYKLDLDIVRPDCTIRHTSARGEADYDVDGNIIGLHGTVQDITERKQAEQELQCAKDALEIANAQLQELNASKDKFFSIIAHDLKSPLNAFLSFADLLDQLDDYDEEKRKALFAQFRSSAEHLFALLDNLLTWARSQQGRIPYEPYRFTLASVVAQTLQLVRPNAATKRIQLINMIPRELSVFADLDMLETVIRNLLTNAIKFTPVGGSVTIAAHANDATIEISVSDTGIGIAPEKAATLFQLGVKTKHAGTAGEKGTGLGLILCKEFVTRHGGTIGCESVVGLGSVFRVTLPK